MAHSRPLRRRVDSARGRADNADAPFAVTMPSVARAWPRQLSTKFVLIGLALLLLALLSIGLTMWVTRQIEGGAAAVNEAGRLRMQAWRLASAWQGGRDPAQVPLLVAEVDRTLALLDRGDPQRPLAVPWSEASRGHFADIQGRWEAMRPLWMTPGDAGREAAALTARIDGLVERIDALVRAMESTMARYTAVLNLFQFVMMAMAVAAAVVSLYVGQLFVIHPLKRLRAGLRQIEAGDFTARVEVESHQEFAELAAGFNHMAQTLQGLYHGLERQVQAKTRDLEAKRARLAALYEVSSLIVNARTLDELARGFARKLRAVSGADAVAIRWSDEGSRRYFMLASDCLPQQLVEDERCLEAGECACGQPAATARTRVIPIATAADRRLGGCAQEGYVCLIGVPIRHQEYLLGEVNLFYRHEALLGEDDRGLYDALAGHLANAAENLRVQALLRESAVSEERGLLARELHDSIAQALSFLKIQVALLKAAVQRGDAAAVPAIIEEIEAGVRESTNDVRELLVHFRTRTPDGDIEDALRTTLRKFELQSGLNARLDLQGHGVALPPDTQLQVLHVVQEALSNVRKHAGASEVSVGVQRGPRWRFTVRDNGQGFATDGARDADTHVGLHIMRERAQRIGARVEVQSRPGSGTEVSLDVPAPAADLPATP